MRPRPAAVGGTHFALWLAACAGCSFHPSGFVDVVDDGGAPPGDDGGGPADAQVDAAVDPPDLARALPVPAGGIILDGVLDEWGAARWYGFDYTTAGLAESITGYTASFVVGFAAYYDATNLWIAVNVSDDRVRYNSSDMWQDDAVGFYLDAAGDAAGPYGNDDYIFVATGEVAYGECDQRSGSPSIFFECAASLDPTAYIIEMRLPLGDFFGLTPAPGNGQTIGFNLGISDDDDINNPGNGATNDHERDAVAWWIHNASACPGCCSGAPARSWCDTSVFGRLLFATGD